VKDNLGNDGSLVNHERYGHATWLLIDLESHMIERTQIIQAADIAQDGLVVIKAIFPSLNLLPDAMIARVLVANDFDIQHNRVALLATQVHAIHAVDVIAKLWLGFRSRRVTARAATSWSTTTAELRKRD
jgi:hypothetical protein